MNFIKENKKHHPYAHPDNSHSFSSGLSHSGSLLFFPFILIIHKGPSSLSNQFFTIIIYFSINYLVINVGYMGNTYNSFDNECINWQCQFSHEPRCFIQ